MLRESFNDDWYVQEETPGRKNKPAVDPLTVPYDCMLYEKRDPESLNGYNMGFYPGGQYRYAKTLHAPESWKSSTVMLEFESVYHRSQVFINGKLSGGRPHGYTLFHVELTSDLIKYGADNVVEVVSLNNDMPNARWYTGSGIIRPVNLLIGGRTHVKPFGKRVTTPSVENGKAKVEVEVEVQSLPETKSGVRAIVEISFPGTAATYKSASPISISSSGVFSTIKQTMTVPGAKLWSPETRHLYSIKLQLLDDKDQVLDKDEDDKRQNVQTSGGCIHHDNGVIGATTLEVAEERRNGILKECGYNAIRSAHNPISTALLRACDKHGLLVMNELCDQWFKPKIFFDYTIDFVDWWERDFESMIRVSYNHPSVIFHSAENEIMETATPEGIEQNHKMRELMKRVDSSRYYTNAINGFMNMIAVPDSGKPREMPKEGAKTEDPSKNMIAILNMLIGTLQKISPWIISLPVVDRKTKEVYEKDVPKYPGCILYGSETGSKNLGVSWPIIEKHNQIIGDFVWTAWDYVGEAGIGSVRYNARMQIIYPWPALVSGQCVVDTTDHRQTQTYNAEYIWGLRNGVTLAVKPVNHGSDKIVTSTWRLTDSIRSWSWEGYEVKGTYVEVYPNHPKVELRLNGKSVSWFRGRTGAGNGFLSKFWVKYQSGTLTAVAFETLRADGSDLAFIPIELTDDSGILKPLADRTVNVRVEGEGTLLGFGSAEAFTTEGFDSTSHCTYLGRALAVVRAGKKAGEVRVTVAAEGVDDVTVVIPVEKA